MMAVVVMQMAVIEIDTMAELTTTGV